VSPAIPILRALWTLQRSPMHHSAADSVYDSGRKIGLMNGRSEAFEAACNALTREQLVEIHDALKHIAYPMADHNLATYIRALIDV
jgi:hypothetical protein